jgi:hypothetical protein
MIWHEPATENRKQFFIVEREAKPKIRQCFVIFGDVSPT